MTWAFLKGYSITICKMRIKPFVYISLPLWTFKDKFVAYLQFLKKKWRSNYTYEMTCYWISTIYDRRCYDINKMSTSFLSSLLIPISA